VNATTIVARHELRAMLRTFLWWVLPVAALTAMTCALQPSLAAGPLAAKLDSMPAGLRKAFGLEAVDFHRPVAFLATNFTMTALTAALLAALLGASTIAKEETLHTAELIFVQPASRTRILVGKLASALVYSIAFPVVLAAVAMIVLGTVAARPLEPFAIAQLFIGTIAASVCFAGLGMLAAAFVRDKRSATSAALGIVLGTYFVGVISTISAPAAPLRYLSPHKLVEATYVAMHGLDPLRVVVLVVIGIAAAVVAIARYRSADIHA
jgi:ABC-2 type transport system permease protein